LSSPKLPQEHKLQPTLSSPHSSTCPSTPLCLGMRAHPPPGHLLPHTVAQLAPPHTGACMPRPPFTTARHVPLVPTFRAPLICHCSLLAHLRPPLAAAALPLSAHTHGPLPGPSCCAHRVTRYSSTSKALLVPLFRCDNSERVVVYPVFKKSIKCPLTAIPTLLSVAYLGPGLSHWEVG
jgi:hypothetical protein